MRFSKYHALGNSYLVVEPAELAVRLTVETVRRVCDRHYGLGADGLLVGPYPSPAAQFGLRLFNPDGGEFEKSGNGLRIFARYLWDRGLVVESPFTIDTPGGLVSARVAAGGRQVAVEMGRVSFDSRLIPVAGPPRDVLNETIEIGGETLAYSAATIGNPHCVVLRPAVSAGEARRLGPLLETAARFPNRTNVQFVAVLDRRNIQMEIWERGVGYTLASGSSSCAAAAVAHRLGLSAAEVTVHMPGGALRIAISPDYLATMAGAVTRVCQGVLSAEIFAPDAAPPSML